MGNVKGNFGTLPVLFVVATAWLCLQAPIAIAATANSGGKGDETMGHSSAEEIVVANVNGKAINMAQLMREMASVSMQRYGQQEISPLLAEKIKREAIDKTIIEELAIQHASARIKGVPPAAMETKIQGVRKQYKSEAEFQKYIKDEFGGEESFKKQMERLLTLELFIKQEFDSKVEVNDQEVKKAYDDSKDQVFVKDEFVQVNDLVFFVDPADPASPAKIESIKKTIADHYANDPSRMPVDGTFAVEKNKPLDKVKDKPLYEAAKVLKEYGWSAPINVDGNLHAVQLIGYKPAVNKSLQEVAAYLKNEIWQQKRQGLLNTWMAGLKDGAKIEIMDLTR